MRGPRQYSICVLQNVYSLDTFYPITADTMTESIVAILQLHTSSPSLQIIARAMEGMVATR